MVYSVVFTPEAEEHLTDLYHYIAEHSSPVVAESYVGSIVRYCEGLSQFPHRGSVRNDIRPGLRLTNYKGRTVIAFLVDDTKMLVAVAGVFYGGQNYALALTTDT